MNSRYCPACRCWVPVESYSPDRQKCWNCIHNQEETNNQEGAN